MNLFFVFGSGADAEVVTPELSGSLLPGVTRDSLLQLAKDKGYRTAERRISTDEWAKKVESGELTEVFACGTAAVITPVGSVKHAEGGFEIAGGLPGPITMELRESLTALQRGVSADPHGWMVSLD
jgi:branched-chain amino acid aminotransferase